jgi:transketolase
LDEEAILKSLAKTKCVVTAEEHNILEVLESISRVLALNNPSQEFVAVNDSFGESGTPAQLMEKYKLNNQVVAAVERVIKENNLLICIEVNIKTHLV